MSSNRKDKGPESYLRARQMRWFLIVFFILIDLTLISHDLILRVIRDNKRANDLERAGMPPETQANNAVKKIVAFGIATSLIMTIVNTIFLTWCAPKLSEGTMRSIHFSFGVFYVIFCGGAFISAIAVIFMSSDSGDGLYWRSGTHSFFKTWVVLLGLGATASILCFILELTVFCAFWWQKRRSRDVEDNSSAVGSAQVHNKPSIQLKPLPKQPPPAYKSPVPSKKVVA